MNLQFRYGLEDKPPLLELIIYGLQWLAIALPMIITVGKVVAGMQYDNPAEQIGYIQKVFLIVGVSVLVQILWGHRLPLIIGPASVLLVGITASTGFGTSAVYTSILMGGIILTLLGMTGLFARLKPLFTPKVIVAILILIGFTLTPMILKLITTPYLSKSGQNPSPLFNIVFALLIVLSMFVANRHLKGIWKSTIIIWAMFLGSIIYFIFFPPQTLTLGNSAMGSVSGLFQNFNLTFVIEPGVLISFLICFLALSINDLGSMESIGEILRPNAMPNRITRGVSFTGIMNMFAGLFGVIGPVNYSMSPGVIATTGVASRFTLIPTGIGLIACAFLPPIVSLIGHIPSVVVGATFIYTLCSQISAGFILAFNSIKKFRLEDGLVLALPLMLSIIISFLPADIVNTFPPLLRPILGNGFVIGVIAVMIMEHLIYSDLNKESC